MLTNLLHQTSVWLCDSIRNISQIPFISITTTKTKAKSCPYLLFNVISNHRQTHSSWASLPQWSPPAFSLFPPLELEMSGIQPPENEVFEQQPVALPLYNSKLSSFLSKPWPHIAAAPSVLCSIPCCSSGLCGGSAVSWSNQAEQPSDPDSPVTSRTLYS